MTTVYIALGSNVGQRERYLDAAVGALRAHPGIEVRQVSGYIETQPVGGPADQPPYLNTAAELDTSLEPEALLDALKEIEDRLGRQERERWGPREIDLDLILYGDRRVDTPRLTVPHPWFRVRRFVLAPLAQIAPGAVDPETGRTVSELLEELGNDQGCP